jgi:short-subunit dehydrogenase
MKPLAFSGRWVIVTGASSGLGASIARSLAQRGAHLLLVARRVERLQALANELTQAYGTQSVVVPCDLAERDAAEHLFRTTTDGREIYALVSNAARYWFGPFTELSELETERMLQLNALTPIALLRRFLPYFDARHSGGALIVTSTGGLMPTPWQALYGASKSMLHAYVQSLQYERSPAHEVALSLCCPGGMPTEMLLHSPVQTRLLRNSFVQHAMLAPEVVACEAIDAFAARRALLIPGTLSRLMVLFSRLLPASTLGMGTRRVYSED